MERYTRVMILRVMHVMLMQLSIMHVTVILVGPFYLGVGMDQSAAVPMYDMEEL
jgi:hypothetical protein